MRDLSEIEIGSPAPMIPPFSSVLKTFEKQDAMGYDCMWFVDHLMGFVPECIWTPDIVPLAQYVKSPHSFYEPYVLMASAGIVTKRIRLGTAVTDAIRRHPALIAQSFLTLSHIANGRVILGIGAGERENTEPYGIDFSKRVSKARECLEIIRLLWHSEGKVDYKGRFWSLHDAVLSLGPFAPGTYPQIWIAAHGPKTYALAAEFGDGWLPIALSPKEYSKGLNAIGSIRRRLGRAESKFVPAMWAWVIMDEDHEECHRVMNSTLGRFYALMMPPERWVQLGHVHPMGDFNMLLNFVPTRFDRKRVLTLIDSVPENVVHEFYIHGSSEDIVKSIEDYARAGLHHIILGNMTSAFAPGKTKSSYDIMSKVTRLVRGR